MIRIFLATALLAAPTEVLAQYEYSDNTELCQRIGEVSQLVMKHRQEGIPQSEARTMWITSLRKNRAPTELYEMVMTVLRAAYKRPQFSSQTYREREMTRFRDEMETICFDIDANHSDELANEAHDEQLWIGDT